MKGVLYKEWLYTKRTRGAIVVHFLSPLLVIALDTLAKRGQVGATGGELDELAIFVAFYVAISFSTIFRSIGRIRAEVSDGSGLTFLLTSTASDALLVVKYVFEAVLNLIALAPVLLWVAISRPGLIGPRELYFAGFASVSLTAFTFAISILFRSEEMYRGVVLFLSLSPMLISPGLETLAPNVRWLAKVMPTLVAFDGFRLIAAGSQLPQSVVVVLLVSLVVSLVLARWRYPRMLTSAFVQPSP